MTRIECVLHSASFNFLYSLIMILNIVVFESMSSGEVIGFISLTLLLISISIIILIAIYISSREKIKVDDL